MYVCVRGVVLVHPGHSTALVLLRGCKLPPLPQTVCLLCSILALVGPFAVLELRCVAIIFSRLFSVSSLCAPINLHARRLLLVLIAVAALAADVPQVGPGSAQQCSMLRKGKEGTGRARGWWHVVGFHVYGSEEGGPIARRTA